jgi:predicted dehydrogenase
MLKVGVFGTGHLGKFHLNNWKEIKEAELIGFYDPDDVIAHEIVEKYHLKRYNDVEKLIADCEVADIIAPTNFHFELCEKAIRKGKHVFVEKPLALTAEDGARWPSSFCVRSGSCSPPCSPRSAG